MPTTPERDDEFDAFYRAHIASITGRAAMFGAGEDAGGIADEALWKAYRQAKKPEDRKRYAERNAFTLTRDAQRKITRHKRRPTRPPLSFQEYDITLEIPSLDGDPETIALQREEVRETLAMMTPEQKAAAGMRYAGYSRTEIAEIFKIRPHTLDLRTLRTKRKLEEKTKRKQ